ncbi:MAG: signal peptide peptidase SppA [bacterium]|nr:signal peptide peptidase SppA [bacterium]
MSNPDSSEAGNVNLQKESAQTTQQEQPPETKELPEQAHPAEGATQSPKTDKPAEKKEKKPGLFSGKGCYIAVIVVLVCILLALVLGVGGCTMAIVTLACSDMDTDTDLTSSTRFKTYIIDKADDKEADSKRDKADKAKDTAKKLMNEEEPAERIFVVPIYGVIASGSITGTGTEGAVTAENITHTLTYIAGQKNVKALILDINSPGGGVTAADNIYHELLCFKKKTNIPIIAMFEGMACSGGYYVAMAADHIIALPTSWTGSIGVIMQLPEFSGLMGKVGVDVNTITSLNANGGKPFKDIGSSYRKMRPEERQLLQTLVTQSWERFTNIVAQGRKGKLNLKQVRSLADGRIYNSDQALKHKLIDQIGYRQDLYKKAREMGKAPKANIVCITSKGSFWDALNSSVSDLGKAARYQHSLNKLSVPTNSASPEPMYMVNIPNEQF